MEKGLWRYEANVAEPSHLNAACLAPRLRGGSDGVITQLHSQSQTQHIVKEPRVIGQYS